MRWELLPGFGERREREGDIDTAPRQHVRSGSWSDPAQLRSNRPANCTLSTVLMTKAQCVRVLSERYAGYPLVKFDPGHPRRLRVVARTCVCGCSGLLSWT